MRYNPLAAWVLAVFAILSVVLINLGATISNYHGYSPEINDRVMQDMPVLSVSQRSSSTWFI